MGVSCVVVATFAPALLLLLLFGYVSALFAQYRREYVPVQCVWLNTTFGQLGFEGTHAKIDCLITVTCLNTNPYDLDIHTPEPGKVAACEPEPGRACSKTVDFGKAHVEAHVLPAKSTAISVTNVTVLADLNDVIRLNAAAEKELITFFEIDVVAVATVGLFLPGAVLSLENDVVQRCGFAVGDFLQMNAGPPACASSHSKLLKSIKKFDSKEVVPFTLELDPEKHEEVERLKVTFFATVMSISGVLGLLLLVVAVINCLKLRICRCQSQPFTTLSGATPVHSEAAGSSISPGCGSILGAPESESPYLDESLRHEDSCRAAGMHEAVGVISLV